jgi:hypothetical protein
MTPSINYFITGIWKNADQTISDVFLHRNVHDVVNNKNSFQPGIKTSEAQVIRLIKSNNGIWTLRWNYSNKSWIAGAKVEAITIGSREFLRTHKDAQIVDNLENMINMMGVL